jgi:hypothetical protein
MERRQELMEGLRELQRVSIEMDQLARRAGEERSSELGAQLVQVVGRWVGLVEGFVKYCPEGEKLQAHQKATRGLEHLLQKLDELKDADEIRKLEREFPPAVDIWSIALTDVIQLVLSGAPR